MAWKATSATSLVMPRPPSATTGAIASVAMANSGTEMARTLPGWSQTRSRAISSWAMFKCRSTPTGTLPTDQDLFDTIARGLDRSNMPQWNTFTKQQSADLVAWVKHFSPRWTERETGNPNPDSSRAGSDCRADQGGPRRVCHGAVLEVPRRAGHGQRTLLLDPHRRSRPPDRCPSTSPREPGPNAATPISDITGFS